MRIGVCIVPTDPWPTALAQARAVEDLGYDHLWTYDHLSWQHYRDRSWFGAIPWLTGIAAGTSRIRVGTLVASPNFREPLTLAKDAIALDHVSGGRFILGVGAGGTGWDAEVYGDPLPRRIRTERFAEMVVALDGLLQPADSHSFSGEHFTIRDARLLPGPLQRPRLPLAVAAAGPKALALTARYADAWITIGDPWRDGSVEGLERAVREQSARLDAECTAIGRDPATIDRILLTGAGDHRPLAGVDAFVECVDRFASIGITDLVVHHPRAEDPHWDDPDDILERIAADALTAARQA
jgi:alkanesulfonate monooxygenase SsuD/methylene tetrahydromethanopterin reductase-like flavin-dependent oxidoreductase (luciferase family)